MTRPDTVGGVLRAAAARLTESATPMLDARVLMIAVTGRDQAALIAGDDLILEAAEQKLFAELVDRREAGEPIALITGLQDFYSRDIKVTRDTLIPRPETEMLVDAALKLSPLPRRVLDLGTGSGCLLATLLAELPEATGIGVDLSGPALAVAQENLIRLGVAARARLNEHDFAVPLVDEEEAFDLIVSNPPYIANSDPLPTSVAAYEPAEALYAGPDGLAAYRVLMPALAAMLAPHGTALLEIGTGQGEAVAALAQGAMPDRRVSVDTDLAGHERMVTITRG